MVALATICCLRVSELLALQVCDLWFDFHAGYGIPGFWEPWLFTLLGAKMTVNARDTTRPWAGPSNPTWTWSTS
jgi:hypothetical protein